VRVLNVRTAFNGISSQNSEQPGLNWSWNSDNTLRLSPFATFASFCSFLFSFPRLLVSLTSLRASAPPREIHPSLIRRHLCFICVSSVALICSSTGCRLFNRPGNGPLQNPMFIPAVDRELLWNQTVDSVDDFFRIEREDRVRVIGGVLTEGRIDTFPTIGSTMLEPWRTDSTRGYEKLHATLQSIRRRATVRVIPTEGGYLLDVTVQKELEDLDKPENATAGGSTLRHDGTLVRQEGPPGRYTVTLGWIPIGRDMRLEQRILADVSARLELGGHSGGWLDAFEELFLPPTDATSGPELIAPGSSGSSLSPNIEALPPPSAIRP
jgi:hypothetical protein